MAILSNGRRAPARRGAATVELAVCLPVLVLLTLAALEITHLVFVTQALVIASHASAREIAAPDGREDNARAVAQRVLDERNVRDAEITFSPASPSTVPRGTPITVMTSVDFGKNALVVPRYFTRRNVHARATFIREGT